MTVAAIEAGGTKIICAIGGSIEDIRTTRMRCVLRTTNPMETAAKMASFFNACRPLEKVDRVGIGTFGPVDQRTGTIGQTLKPGWSGFNWRIFAEAIFGNAKVTVDTDVNAAALGEARYGAARGLQTSAYLTIGTGIGGGIILDNRLLQGLVHPEIGHMLVPRVADDTFVGVCPYHTTCLEGFASGRALGARAGSPPELLLRNDDIWMLEATYLGIGIVNLITVVAPQRIVLGGGVMKQPLLLNLVREEVAGRARGYLDGWLAHSALETTIVAPDLGDDAGIVGAFELARAAD